MPTHVCVVIRQDQHTQTSETLRLEVVEAVVGDDAEAVERKATKRADELNKSQGGRFFVDYTPLCIEFWTERAPVVTIEESP